MAAVTIHAVGGFHQPPLQGRAVHALVERSHKSRAHEGPVADFGFLGVAGFTKVRLGQLACDLQRLARTASHRQMVTVQTSRCFGHSGSERMTMS